VTRKIPHPPHKDCGPDLHPTHSPALVHTFLTVQAHRGWHRENLFHMKTSYNAVYDGMYEYVLVRISIRTSYRSVCWYIRVCTCLYQYILVCTGTYQYVLHIFPVQESLRKSMPRAMPPMAMPRAMPRAHSTYEYVLVYTSMY
jgi:hypothetical protein